MLSVDRVDPGAGGEAPLPREFIARMVAARKAKGWSQKRLAGEVGCSQGLISQIEGGQRGASGLALKIAEALDIDPPFLVQRDLEKKWIATGLELRRRDPESFENILRTAELALRRAPAKPTSEH
jgi:transcriptional regulator with XRE-family HTH domain